MYKQNTASRIKVLHNIIYNTPRAGINIGDGAFGGREIAYNDVYNTALETSDRTTNLITVEDHYEFFFMKKPIRVKNVRGRLPRWFPNKLGQVQTTMQYDFEDEGSVLRKKLVLDPFYVELAQLKSDAPFCVHPCEMCHNQYVGLFKAHPRVVKFHLRALVSTLFS